MSLNPFEKIDINSCLHEELAPYGLTDSHFYCETHYYDLYLKNLFDQNQIQYGSEEKGKIQVPTDSMGFLLNIDGQSTNIDLDRIQYEQRKTFYIDEWYPLVNKIASSLTFKCYIINLTKKHRQLLISKQFDNPGLQNLKKKIRKIMIKNHHIKWWFVKLNSVSPKDENKSGKQHKFNSVNLILKRLVESERTFTFLVNDDNARIILRPWLDIDEKWEFRCFIRNRKLRAISHYKCYTYYPEFQDKSVQETIRQRITKFFQSAKPHIPYDDCVMDIVIWDDSEMPSFQNQHIHIIEFNEFGGETPCGAGLYNWVIDFDILYKSKSPPIRFVEEESEIDKLARELDSLAS